MAFHFDEPELEVYTTLTVYPGLSTWGRLRAELRVDLRRELVTDLFWGFSFYGSLDNEPTGLEAVVYDVPHRFLLAPCIRTVIPGRAAHRTSTTGC